MNTEHKIATGDARKCEVADTDGTLIIAAHWAAGRSSYHTVAAS